MSATSRVSCGSRSTERVARSERWPRASTWYFPGAKMRSIGVFPTKAPSTQTCAAVGTDRSNSLPASWPARCSSAWRLATSGGGPDWTAKCGDLVLLSGRAGAEKPSCEAPAAAVAETEVAPAVSTTACALETLQLTDKKRQDRTNDDQEQQTRSPFRRVCRINTSDPRVAENRFRADLVSRLDSKAAGKLTREETLNLVV